MIKKDIPKISIVIPAYNREQYIGEAIESAIAQTTPSMEIVIIDDGSTDNTAEIVSRYVSNNVRYVWKEHEGQPHSRNRGIQESRGDFILWLDSDDTLMPHTVSTYIDQLSRYPEVDVLYGKIVKTNAQDKILSENFHQDYYHNNDELISLLFSANRVPQPGTMVRKSIYERYGGYNLDFKRAPDYEFIVRIAPHAIFKHVGIAVSTWRWHENNNASGQLITDFSRELEVANSMLKRFSIQQLFPDLDWNDKQTSLAVAYISIGNVFMKWCDFSVAHKYFKKSADLIPSDRAFYKLGVTAFELGRYDESKQHFDMTLKMTPDHIAAKSKHAEVEKIIEKEKLTVKR